MLTVVEDSEAYTAELELAQWLPTPEQIRQGAAKIRAENDAGIKPTFTLPDRGTVTCREAGLAFGWPIDKVQRAIRDGSLTAEKVKGVWRLDAASVRALMRREGADE